MRNEWIIIVILIIIIVILVWNSSKKKISVLSTQDDESVKSATFKYKGDDNQILGHLNDKCPCEDGLICDKGICKRNTNVICDSTDECSHTDLCILKHCVRKPNGYLQSTSSDNLSTKSVEKNIITFDGHLLQLKDQQFIFPGWWDLNQIISVIDSNMFGTIYVSTVKGIYKIMNITNTIQKINCIINSDKVYNDNTEIITGQLFRFARKIHLLFNGNIYQMNTPSGDTGNEFPPLSEIKNESVFDNWEFSHSTFLSDMNMCCIFLSN